MASMTIRNLDAALKARLRVRAARHGRSMEDEVREILRQVLAQSEQTPQDLAAALRRRFASLGTELEPLPRDPIRDPPTLEP